MSTVSMLSSDAESSSVLDDCLMYMGVHDAWHLDRNSYIGIRHSGACSRRKGMANEAVVFDCLHG